MSFAAIAVGVGAAASIGGSLIQAGAAGDAADTSSAQAMANAANLRNSSITGSRLQKQSGQRADALLQGSGAQADALLQQGFQGARQDLAPWDSLGLQGSNAFARFLGFAPEFQGQRPVAPQRPRAPTAAKAKTVDDLMAEWAAAAPASGNDPNDPANQAMARARLTKRVEREAKQSKVTGKAATVKAAADFKKAQAKYKTDLAKFMTDSAAFTARQRAAGDFGDFFKPFTQADLMRDPVYKTELDENVSAWDQSAAARGSLMSGNTVAGLRELTAAGIQRGFDRDWNQDERKFNALSGLNNMGLGVRSGLADARMQTAGARSNVALGVGSQRANTGVQVAANRANTLLQGSGLQAQFAQQGADSRAAGQIGQGQAYGNAFNNIGQLGLLYGLGAFK